MSDGVKEIRELLAVTDSNLIALRERLSFLRENRRWSINKIIEKCGLRYTDENRLRRFLNVQNGNSTRIPKDDYERLVVYLYDNGLWYGEEISKRVTSFRDHLFHSFLDFLETDQASVGSMRARVPGIYRIWRHSISHPERYIVGCAKIWHEETSGAICVEETYILDNNQKNCPEDRSVKDVLQFRRIREVYFGYLGRKSRTFFILSRNDAVSHLQMTMLPSVFQEGRQVTTMSGAVLGMSGNRPFTSKILLERFDGDEPSLLGQVGVFSRDLIPEMVLNVLNGVEPKDLARSAVI